MKRTMIILMLLMTMIGSWAADVNGTFGTASTYSVTTTNGKTLKLNVVNAGEFATWYNKLDNWSTTPRNTDLQSANKIIVTGKINGDDLAQIGACLVSSGTIDLYGAQASDDDVRAKVTTYSWGNTSQMSVILPKGSAISLLGFAYTNDWNNLTYKFRSVLKYDGTTLSYTGNNNGAFATDLTAAVADHQEIAQATGLNIQMTSLNNGTDIPFITNSLTSLKNISVLGNKAYATQIAGDLTMSGLTRLETLEIKNSVVNGSVTVSNNKVLEYFSLEGSTLNSTAVNARSNPQLAVVIVPNGTTVDLTGSQNAVTANMNNNIFTLNISEGGLVVRALNSDAVKALLNGVTAFRVQGSGMTAADFAALSSVQATTIDLSGAVFAPSIALQPLSNTSVKYIIMPDGSDKTVVNANTFDGCTALVAAFAGTYTTQSDGYPWITEITAYVKTPNSLRATMEQDARIKVNDNSYRSAKIIKATLSGNLMPDDLSKGYNYNDLDADGHLAYQASGWSISSTGTTTHGNTALLGANLQYLDLTDAVFPTQRDMNFTMLVAATSLSTLKLPNSPAMTEIPDGCLINFRQLTELCIPYNYETIGQAAFYNSTLLHITTTDADGNLVDKGERTFALSANLKEVKAYAFNVGTDVSNSATDVYVLAKTAPKCAKDAFTAGMLYGWGGYNRVEGAITRASYDRFTILHFPDDVTLTEARNYTDLTRNYTQPDATLATDGDGNVMMWPSQSEYNRSIEQANTGYIWGAWNEDRQQYTHAITTQGSGASITQAQGDAMWTANGSPANMTYNTDFMGWHQFTLAYTSHYENPAPQWNLSSYKYNDWYTLCVPFDMTKADLLKFFGTEATAETGTITVTDKANNETVNVNMGEKRYPDVRTLIAVTRNEPNIVLRLSKNLTVDDNKYDYQSSLEPTYTAYADGDVVIKAGYPYLIKPALSEAELQKAQNGNRTVSLSSNMANCTACLDAMVHTIVPKLDYKVNAYDGNSNQIEDYTYSFFGTFMKAEIPASSGYYYLGRSTSLDRNKFFRQTKTTPLAWNAFSCVIGAKAVPEVKRNNTTDGSTFSMSTTEMVIDDFTSGAAAKYDMSFDNSTATGISEVTQQTTTQTESKKVYTLNGQYVGDSLDTLAKGIYIVNGKKVIIK